MYSVVVAELHYLTRQGLTSVVNRLPRFQLQEVLAQPEAMVAQLAAHRPDVLIVGSSVAPHLLHSAEQKTIVERNVLLMLHSEDTPTLRKWLQWGILGAVTPTCSEKELIQAMESVASGKRFFCNRVLECLAEVTPAASESFTEREQEVLKEIARGYTTVQIAENLHISVHTVNTHRKNLLRKLQLKNAAQLVSFAVQYVRQGGTA